MIRMSRKWIKKVSKEGDNRYKPLSIERAVFDCLEDEDNDEYEELEDDFLMIANEGQPALVLVETEVSQKD